MRLKPSAPWIVSLPAPEQTKSFPCRERTLSFPPSARITSGPLVPLITSPCWVPVIVATFPKQVAAAFAVPAVRAAAELNAAMPRATSATVATTTPRSTRPAPLDSDIPAAPIFPQSAARRNPFLAAGADTVIPVVEERSGATQAQPRVAREASQTVGNTPLVALQRLTEAIDAEVFAKLEYLNAGGSVKDRIGVAMIDAAERDGLIRPGRSVIVEPTSGNTGIALAMVCAARGYELILTLPEGMTRERTALLRTYGAEVHETPSLGGMNEAVALAEEIREQRKGFMPMQFSNPANAEVHRRTTAEEIWRDTDGLIGAFVAGVGTGGTITGVGQMLRERAPEALVVAVEPAGSPVLSGGAPGPHKIQGIGAGLVRALLDRSVIDEIVAVSDEDALETARLVAREEGVLAGISAGANIKSALEIAALPGMAGKRVVTVVCDSGEPY